MEVFCGVIKKTMFLKKLNLFKNKIHLFIEYIFMGYLQFTRYCSRYNEYLSEQNRQRKVENIYLALSEYFINFLKYCYI